MRLDPRVEFHRVIVKAGEESLRATSTGGQRSSRVASLSGANGLVQLPTKMEGGPDRLEAGSYADAVIIGELQMSMAQYSSSLEEPCIPMPRSRIPRPSLQLRVADVALRASGGVFLHVYLKWVLSQL